MNPRMQFYVRLDGSGKMVPGSGVWRLKQPRTGRWKMVNPTESNTCCGYSTTTTTTEGD